MDREATSPETVKKQTSKDLVHNSAMPPRRRFDSARAALLSLTLGVVVGCVSVSPPSPAPASVAPSRAPAATAPPTLDATTAPTQSAGPSATVPTEAPDGSPAAETPGPTVDPSLGAQIGQVTAQIPPIRQLEPTRDVPYQFIARDDFRQNLLDTAFEDTPREWIEAEERLLKRLGLVPPDDNLLDLILKLYGAAVAAYYQPDNGSFYIIERDAPFGATDKITVAHEYAHALQDQHFGLEASRIKDLTAGDAILAQLAVIEGDATLTSQQWLTNNLTDEERVQLLREALGDVDQDVLEDMPLILRRQLEFPYGEGFRFVNDIWRVGGFEAVNQALQDPPESTEQILHSDKYFDEEAPVEVTLDDVSATLGDGWSRTYEQTIGELGIQVFVGGGERPTLNIPGLPVEWPQQEAAAGWGGDRLDMYENGDQWAIVWETAWDSAADMDEFATRADELLVDVAEFSSSAAGDPARNGRVIWIASDQATLESVTAATQ